MVPIEQVQRGAARYVEGEFLSKIPGWQRWAVGAAAAMVIDQIPKLIEPYRSNATVAAMGIIGPDGIDIDKVYPYLRAQAEKGPVTFDTPMIGAVKLDASDVEKIYRCIMEG